MTQTKTDPKDWSEAQCDRWLAEEPCPKCLGKKRIISQTLYTDAHSEPVESCNACLDTKGKPTGLAFPWASESCPGYFMGDLDDNGTHERCVGCNGSGRAPKALGLVDLLNVNFHLVCWAMEEEDKSATKEDRGPDFLLAAKRAVCASLMR